MKKSELPDPFEKARLEKGFGDMDDQNDPVKILLRHKDVRKTAYKQNLSQSSISHFTYPWPCPNTTSRLSNYRCQTSKRA